MGVYSLNALLASEVELENPTIEEANGTFERSEMESAFSWLCEQAKQTRFELEKFHPSPSPATSARSRSRSQASSSCRPIARRTGITTSPSTGKRKRTAGVSAARVWQEARRDQSPRNTNSSATRFSERRAVGIASESAPNRCRDALPAAWRSSAALRNACCAKDS